MNKKLIFLQLNELNFSVAEKYVKKYKLNNIKKIIKENFYITESEKKYELLEPWIQWASIQTGKTADEHKIFRLGDVIDSSEKQIYEIIEERGYSVGALMPMNTKNSLKNPKYFIPDAWTDTKTDNSFWSNLIYSSVKEIVNNNSNKKFSLISAFYFFLSFLRFAKYKNYLKYFNLFFKGLKRKYNLALFMDLFLNDIHLNLLSKSKSDFSSVFFNAGAHIQHHYFFNTEFDNDENQQNPDWYMPKKIDPFLDVLKLYDYILGEMMRLNGYCLLIATGLSQAKYDRVKYYYRLKNHKNFLDKLSIKYKNVQPRMTRDFLINFENDLDASVAEKTLKEIYTIQRNEEKHYIFEQIDNRGNSLFITLTYPKEIKKDQILYSNNYAINFYDSVSFVALKNGMHDQKGYVYFDKNFNISNFVKSSPVAITKIYNLLLDFFPPITNKGHK